MRARLIKILVLEVYWLQCMLWKWMAYTYVTKLDRVVRAQSLKVNDVVIAMGTSTNTTYASAGHRLQKSWSMQERPFIVGYVRRDTKIHDAKEEDAPHHRPIPQHVRQR